MKKILITLLLLITFSALIACSNNVQVVTNQPLEATKPEIAVPVPVPESEPIQLELTESESPALEAEMGKSIHTLVPEGWHILHTFEDMPQQVDGDLNQDGISDIALVIEEDLAADEAPSRSLIIAFGNENHTYNLSIKADKAILKADEGGVWGDPLVGISIDRGSLLIDFFGGSSWRWYRTYRFRFQDNDWFMIGATQGSFHTHSLEDSLEEDFNLLTGEYIQKKSDENFNWKEAKSNRGKKRLIKLSEFEANSIPEL